MARAAHRMPANSLTYYPASFHSSTSILSIVLRQFLRRHFPGTMCMLQLPRSKCATPHPHNALTSPNCIRTGALTSISVSALAKFMPFSGTTSGRSSILDNGCCNCTRLHEVFIQWLLADWRWRPTRSSSRCVRVCFHYHFDCLRCSPVNKADAVPT